MAYVKPIIRIRENDRHICRGCYFDNVAGRFALQATSAETLKVQLDFTDVLDGDTITVATSADGVTATVDNAAHAVSIVLPTTYDNEVLYSVVPHVTVATLTPSTGVQANAADFTTTWTPATRTLAVLDSSNGARAAVISVEF